MRQGKNSSQGFTLIAALLILVLLSGVAVGLFYMVTNEARMGGNDTGSQPGILWRRVRHGETYRGPIGAVHPVPGPHELADSEFDQLPPNFCDGRME